MKYFALLSVIGLCVAAAPADAAPVAQNVLSIPLSFNVKKTLSVQAVRYKCDDKPAVLRAVLPKGIFSASYINADAISLVAVSLNKKTQIFTNVVSASGARYVASHYEWWEEHGTVSFTDTMQDKVVLTCNEVQ